MSRLELKFEHSSGAISSHPVESKVLLLTVEFLPFPALLILAVFTGLLVRRRNPFERAVLILLGVYLSLAAARVFFPIFILEGWPYTQSMQSVRQVFIHINWVPFAFGNLFSAPLAVIAEQFAGNVLLTLPAGFLLPFLCPLRGGRLTRWTLAFGMGFEALQLVFQGVGLVSGYGHSIDVNDAILNTAGFFLGVAVFHWSLPLLIHGNEAWFKIPGLSGWLRAVRLRNANGAS